MAAAVPPRPGRVRHALSELFLLVSCWFDGTSRPHVALADAESEAARWRGAYETAVGDLAESIVEIERVTGLWAEAVEAVESARRWAAHWESEAEALRQQLGAA